MNRLTILILSFSIVFSGYSQQVKQLTLQEVIDIALDQSLDIYMAKHRYRSGFWKYRSHIAGYLPSLTLDATIPELNRSISGITMPDGSEAFINRKYASSFANLSLSQNIFYTGGKVFVNSDLQRIDLLGDSVVTSFLSTPVSIGFVQPLFAFNPYKWEKQIEPLKYEESKSEYLETREEISIKAVDYFFDLMLAQINLKMAELNYNNNDSIYKISVGRYNLGTIAENELLQMELALLNSEADLKQAGLDLEVKKFRLRSFLGFTEDIDIFLILPEELPDLQIDVGKAIDLAKTVNPIIKSSEISVKEAEKNVAKTRADNRFNANLVASYGLTQSAGSLEDAYRDPENRQMATVGIMVPILDWGKGKGKYKMAMSGLEVVRTSAQQDLIDFEQDVFLKVAQFNMQKNQVMIKAKADTIALKRYEVTKQRFFIGKINILDLNVALKEKDEAKRTYINSLKTYWEYYYLIRKLALYDFEKTQPLTADFDSFIK